MKSVFYIAKKGYASFKRNIGKLRRKVLYLYLDSFIKKQYNHLSDKKKLTKEQKKEIQSFYKDIIGKKVSLNTHEYFYSRTGIYSKEFVPKNLQDVIS